MSPSNLIEITVEGPGAEAVLARIRQHADILGIAPLSECIHAGLAAVNPSAPPRLMAHPAFPLEAGHA